MPLPLGPARALGSIPLLPPALPSKCSKVLHPHFPLHRVQRPFLYYNRFSGNSSVVSASVLNSAGISPASSTASHLLLTSGQAPMPSLITRQGRRSSHEHPPTFALLPSALCTLPPDYHHPTPTSGPFPLVETVPFVTAPRTSTPPLVFGSSLPASSQHTALVQRFPLVTQLSPGSLVSAISHIPTTTSTTYKAIAANPLPLSTPGSLVLNPPGSFFPTPLFTRPTFHRSLPLTVTTVKMTQPSSRPTKRASTATVTSVRPWIITSNVSSRSAADSMRRTLSSWPSRTPSHRPSKPATPSPPQSLRLKTPSTKTSAQ